LLSGEEEGGACCGLRVKDETPKSRAGVAGDVKCSLACFSRIMDTTSIHRRRFPMEKKGYKKKGYKKKPEELNRE